MLIESGLSRPSFAHLRFQNDVDSWRPVGRRICDETDEIGLASDIPHRKIANIFNYRQEKNLNAITKCGTGRNANLIVTARFSGTQFNVYVRSVDSLLFDFK